MSELRARRGNTQILLADRILTVSIADHRIGSFTLSASQIQAIWAQVTSISIPVQLGEGAMGVGGIGSEIEVTRGMTRLTLAWWMGAPPAWKQADGIFDLLAEHLPREIAARYDFARGGE